MIYLLNVKPYNDKINFKHEFINECFLILVLYTLYYSTNYLNIIGQKGFQYNVGWIIIGLIMLVLLANMLIIIWQVLRVPKRKVTALYYKSRFYKMRLQKRRDRLFE